MLAGEFASWTLAEARRRATGAGSPRSRANELKNFFAKGQLVAHGLNKDTGQKELIDKNKWSSLDILDVQKSQVRFEDRSTFIDVQVWPTLHAPSAGLHIDRMALSTVFRKFILDDPEIQQLRIGALAADRRLYLVYQMAYCQTFPKAYWPMCFGMGSLAGGMSVDAPSRILSNDKVPASVQAAADVVCLRYSALLELLRTVMTVRGDPVRSRDPQLIIPSIWSHGRFSIDAANGDIYSITEKEDVRDFDELYVPRWRGLHLSYESVPVEHQKDNPAIRRPSSPMSDQQRPLNLSRGEQAVLDAVQELFPSGFAHMKAKERNLLVRNHLRAKADSSDYSDQTIKRALSKIKDSY